MKKRTLASRLAQVMHHLSPWPLLLANAHNSGVMALFITATQQMQITTAPTGRCRYCCNWCIRVWY